MDLSKGAKRLTNRKRAIPAVVAGVSSASTGKRKVVVPEVLPSDLPTPVFGIDSSLQKEFNRPAADDMFGIPVTAKEKDIISSKSLLSMRQLPQLEITDIKYTIMSHEELEKIAVCEVKNKEDSGLFSVNDPRLGVVDSHVTCVTCLKDNLACSGHLGIIRLNEHIIHPITRKEVLYVLSSVCGSCGGLLLPYETIKDLKILNLTGSARLKELAKASEKVPCRRNVAEKESGVTACIPNPTYKIDGGKIFYNRDEKNKASNNVLSVKEIETILDSISDEDAKIMGFEGDSHPRRFIMKSLAVIPLCARAPVIQDGAIWKDDLTVMYQDIVRINNELAKDLKEDEREKYIDNLVFSIEHMINNADQKYHQLKRKPYQSLQDRIQGKDALIRDALMGKRVNFSARTVIGPDPTLKFGQVRVPRMMAPYLTQHEIIGPENIAKMTFLLRSGKITYITPAGGRMAGRRMKVTEKHQKEHVLVLGDEVDRWLSDGDYIILNRQPTLHKQGMLGHEVVLRNTLTFGLHLGVTRAFNAD
jgi:DNA-directed RNA polymerase beta' subunit